MVLQIVDIQLVSCVKKLGLLKRKVFYTYLYANDVY